MSVGIFNYLETSDSSKVFKYTVDVFADLATLTEVEELDLAFVSTTTGIFGFRNLKGLYQYKGGAWVYASKDLQDLAIAQQSEIDNNEQAITDLENTKVDSVTGGGVDNTDPLNPVLTCSGFIDYNDTTGAINITSDTWTDIPNNGAGSFTNKTYKPIGVTELLDINTGYLNCSQLSLGDTVLIRNDYTINPNTNNAQLRFRYELGSGGGVYNLEKIIGRLDSGSGQGYRFSLTPDLIYMGDTNTKDNPIKLQVYCTSNATLINAGSVITVVKK